MPSVTLDLGKYVTLRGPRKDGTYRVLFEVPPRLRPSGWLPTIPIPVEGRKGDLNDEGEVARIRADARRLLLDLNRTRLGRPAAPPTRTVETLIRTWQATQEYKAIKPRTARGYEQILRDVRAWSDSLGHPDPTPLTVAEVQDFLALFDDRPTQRWQVRKVFRMVMQQAVSLGWRDKNPVSEIKLGMPKSRVHIWEQADLEANVWAALGARQPAVAALILMQWEIGQRPTDTILFRRQGRDTNAGEFNPREGVFRFWQSKTESYVTIPVSARLVECLDAVKVAGSPYLFHDAATGRPFPDIERLSHVFATFRTDSRLKLHALRHSCIVQLARAGCTVPEIAAITGHAPGTVEAILKTYLPRDNAVAWAAQRKRGLIGA